MQKTIKWNNSFAVRMILAFVIVILIPALFTSASFYVVSNNTVKNNVRESSVQIAKQAADSLSFILSAGSDVSDLIYSDLRIQKVVSDEGLAKANLKEWRENEDYLKGVLNNIVYSSSSVNMLYVLKDTENGWGSGTFSKVKLARYKLDTLDWAREARRMDGGLVWLGLTADRFSGGGDDTELVLPIARVLKDFDTMENIGYILVNLNGRKIIEKIRQMKLGESGRFFVVNEDGRIMIDAEPSLINTIVPNKELRGHITGNDFVEFEFKQGDVPYYGVKQRLSNGWLIVGIVPVHEITNKLDALHHNIVMSFAAFTLVGILIGLVLANRVTRPIKQLTQQMRLVQQGDLTVRTNVHSNDELGLMSIQFNRMIVEINRLMDQVKLEQQQKQDAELRAVTHRINPHFLFNTLSTLRWLIKYDQSVKAYDGISALIRLLEANMGKKSNFITVEEELEIIEKYLAILELRYSKKFVMQVELDANAAQFVIPRMLIQPLVENSIFHGIVPKGTDGEIHIHAKSSGGTVFITVRDNGIGMQPGNQLLERTLEEAVSSGNTGIGLRHVHESIRLYYGRGSEASICSRPDEGTTATIVLYLKPERTGE
ncbi:cache domain-containing sensor histidine kinase [Paenibacillus alkalitolerans]|uniref:cache domain-containing sensor histidine kinase n=1 Tax=Paenibacillus alkalitolerans TaxID=2799335 RepID=UPI0018F4F9EF|nr:sensor histidine kinase [Paenibacillus alkalitolerans]